MKYAFIALFTFAGLGMLAFCHDPAKRVAGSVYSSTAVILLFMPDQDRRK